MRENFAVTNKNIGNIIHLHPSPDAITTLDFNFCYWVSSKKICDFVKQCPSLTELAVANSTVGTQELADILCNNTKISKLSLSIASPEYLWPNIEPAIKCMNDIQQNSKKESTATLWGELLSLSNFGKCQETLAQLESLDLHMGEHLIILATVIRLIKLMHFSGICNENYLSLFSSCKNLKNMSLKLEHEQGKQFPSIRTAASAVIESLLKGASSKKPPVFWNHIFSKTIQSFAFHIEINRTKPRETHTEKFIQKIGEICSGNLQCWWAPLPSVPVQESDFNLKTMFAWKESYIIPFRMPVMESFASNMYMQIGSFGSPQLKQIECGFRKNVIAIDY